METLDTRDITGDYLIQAVVKTANMLENTAFQLEYACSDNVNMLQVAIPEAKKVIKFVISAMYEDSFNYENFLNQEFLINSINRVIQEAVLIFEGDLYLRIPQDDLLINAIKAVLKRESYQSKVITVDDLYVNDVIQIILRNNAFVQQVAQDIVTIVAAICNGGNILDDGSSILDFVDSINFM